MSLKQEFELLRRVPIFAEIEPSKLKLLAFMSERVGFDPGKNLMRQGDPADAAYLIIDGQAEVVLKAADVVALPAVEGNGDVGEFFEGLFGIYSGILILALSEFVGAFYRERVVLVHRVEV